MRGLIVRHGFLPAEVYVTVLIDVDFHRGFSERPVFFRTSKPLFAIIEMIPTWCIAPRPIFTETVLRLRRRRWSPLKA